MEATALIERKMQLESELSALNRRKKSMLRELNYKTQDPGLRLSVSTQIINGVDTVRGRRLAELAEIESQLRCSVKPVTKGDVAKIMEVLRTIRTEVRSLAETIRGAEACQLS